MTAKSQIYSHVECEIRLGGSLANVLKGVTTGSVGPTKKFVEYRIER
jgi:hypothetical protein